MFEDRKPPEPDKILRLMALFAKDPRPDKIDLGVGVYRTPEGRTPVMAAVREAEKRIWDRQETKGYVALSGDPAFLDAIRDLILGGSVEEDRVAVCATPGGTGAVRQILEMTKRLAPEATVWIPDPTWPNHPAIIDHLSQERKTYRYYDYMTGGIDRAKMRSNLILMKQGDLVLLHGCCHNPTGADMTREDWEEVASICSKTGAIPFVDMAYMGFGEGLEADAAGTRLLASKLPEVFISVSCSKNFGLYRERVGAVIAITENAQTKEAAAGTLANLNRQNYAFPPDHGARIVQTILGDPALKDKWRDELRIMRETIRKNRHAFAQAMQEATGSDRYACFATQQGLFSLAGLDEVQVAKLRDYHGVYIVGDGRLNMAGLTPPTIPRVAKAIADVLASGDEGA